jgi:hypothetical protein
LFKQLFVVVVYSVGRMESGDEAVTLQRSGSVSEKASLWNKPAQTEPPPTRNKGKQQSDTYYYTNLNTIQSINLSEYL